MVKITVNKANYSGETVGTAYVKSGQETNDATYILPTLPVGMSWAAITVEGTTPPLIKGGSDQPSITGNTLSFKTSSQPANTSATITIPILGGINYEDSNFALTVVATTPSPAPEPRQRYNLSVDPQSEWDFGQVLWNGLVHGKEFVVKNTGNRTLRQLSVSLSGDQAEHFERNSCM